MVGKRGRFVPSVCFPTRFLLVLFQQAVKAMPVVAGCVLRGAIHIAGLSVTISPRVTPEHVQSHARSARDCAFRFLPFCHRKALYNLTYSFFILVG